MYRFLLSGRWIALLIVGLILVVAFTLAGFWQLGKFRSPASAGPGSGTVTEATADPQNLGYALQWWAFAGATIYFGIRAIRMEAEDRLMPPEQPPAQPPEESDAARP